MGCGFSFCNIYKDGIVEKEFLIDINNERALNIQNKKLLNDLPKIIEKEPENFVLYNNKIDNDRIFKKNIIKSNNEYSINKFDSVNLLLENKENNLVLEKREKAIEYKEKLIKDKEKMLEEKLIQFEKNKEKIIDEEIQKRKETILIGLNNIGATCYMNATLQCLSNTKQLTDYFLNTYKPNPKNVMANEYYKVLQNIWNFKNNKISYSPNSFKIVLSRENPLFAGVTANDSKDLINFLLERFHQELNNVNENNINNNKIFNSQEQINESYMLSCFLEEFKNNYNSPISNIFYGILETKSQCIGCQTIKYNFQIYSFLEFPLQQVNQYCFNNGKRSLINNDGTNPDVDLYECFDYYGKVDLMSGENQMHCNICNKLFDAYYSTIIYSGPNNLIINLNRGKGAIYECKVIFPEQLNIFNYVTYKAGITVYELYAVICHLGPSSLSGHFVAYCKNRMDNKWYLYNDGLVSPCTTKYQYQQGMPYILFYRSLGDF